MPPRLPTLLALCTLAASAASAQPTYRIERISRDLERIPGATTQVEWRPGGVFVPNPLAEGTLLNPDDDIRTANSTIGLLIRCGPVAFRFSGPFRIIVLPPDGGRCLIHLLSGTAEVLGNSPSGIKAGEIVAGALSTQYQVTVAPPTRAPQGRRWSGETPGTVTVFEGRVLVSSPADEATVGAGAAVTAAEGRFQRIPLSAESVRSSAQLYARLDLSASALPPAQRRDAIGTLVPAYERLLTRGGDSETRLQLVATQVRYQVASPDALYHLDRAAGADTTAGSRAATVQWLRGAVHRSLGDTASANRYLRRAQTMDPQVETRIIERYRIDPRILNASRIERPGSGP